MRHRIIIAAVMAGLTIGAYASDWKYYETTGDGVNLRQAPVDGKVIGQVSKGTMFSSPGPSDGWCYMTTPLQGGYISEKFVREVPVGEYSRRMIGDVMGTPTDPAWSYSLGNLSEHDGWMVLNFNNWSEPMESGFRMSDEGYTYVGRPSTDGITFTYRVRGLDLDSPVRPQLEGVPELERPYDMIVEKTSDGSIELRTFDNSFQLQEPKGPKDPAISERSLFELKGNVKKLVRARSFTPQYMEGMENILLNFVDQIEFSREGNITAYLVMDSDTERTIAQYVYQRDGNKVKVTGKRDNYPFEAHYTQTNSNFSIDYSDGEAELKLDEGENGALVDYGYSLEWNGYPRTTMSEEMYAPFMIEAYGALSMTSEYDKSTNLPVKGEVNVDYGGDGWVFSVEYRDLQTDSQGNWTKRVAYQEGTPVFVELRNIEYY